MLVGYGHAYYWQQKAAPPAATGREGNMHAVLGGAAPKQTAHGQVQSFLPFLIGAIDWIRRILDG
jgi:hypothetical protein